MAGNMTWFVLPPAERTATHRARPISSSPRRRRTSLTNDGQRDFHPNFTLDIEPELAPRLV